MNNSVFNEANFRTGQGALTATIAGELCEAYYHFAKLSKLIIIKLSNP